MEETVSQLDDENPNEATEDTAASGRNMNVKIATTEFHAYFNFILEPPQSKRQKKKLLKLKQFQGNSHVYERILYDLLDNYFRAEADYEKERKGEEKAEENISKGARVGSDKKRPLTKGTEIKQN